ncbi:hypothetical protein F5Y03DRAFT_394876 [Xylaria venustula]|nr:hypothetical protein F5Y03DRAFT_394876 [Xylaria venustula]
MAELLGVVIAGAQAVDYALQLCKVIDKALHSAGCHERYQKTSRELTSILQLIQSSPHLQAPEIISCTNDLIGTANSICSALRQRTKNRFIASIAFAVKQKSYDDAFAHLEHQKTTLGLCISQLNANALGELTATSNDILTTVQSFYEQSIPYPSLTPYEQIPATDKSEDHEEKSIDNPISSGPDVHIAKKLLSLKHNDDSWSPQPGASGPKGSDTLPRNEKRVGRVKASMTRNIGVHRKHQAHSFDPSDDNAMRQLQGNIQRSDTFQIVGMEIGPNTSITDADLVRVTTGLSAHSNIHTGNGTQVIGQRVCAGAKPRIFSGEYCNNIHRGTGDQIIGFAFE